MLTNEELANKIERQAKMLVGEIHSAKHEVLNEVIDEVKQLGVGVQLSIGAITKKLGNGK